jgi:hypothetical protein
MLQLTISTNYEAIQRSGWFLVATSLVTEKISVATSLATEKISVTTQLVTQLHESQYTNLIV